MTARKIKEQGFILDGECFSNDVFCYSFIKEKASVLLSDNENIIELRHLLKKNNPNFWFGDLCILGVLIRRNNSIKTTKYNNWKALGSDARTDKMNSITTSIRKLRNDLSGNNIFYIPPAYQFFECGDAFIKDFMGGGKGLGKSRRLKLFCNKKGYKSFFDDDIVEFLGKLLAYIEKNNHVKEKGGGKFEERMFVLKIWKFFKENINIEEEETNTLVSIILYLVCTNYKNTRVKTEDIKRWLK